MAGIPFPVSQLTGTLTFIPKKALSCFQRSDDLFLKPALATFHPSLRRAGAGSLAAAVACARMDNALLVLGQILGETSQVQ